MLSPRDPTEPLGKSNDDRVRFRETFLLQNPRNLAELIVAMRRTMVVADYIYDPVVTDVDSRLITEGLGQHDKIIYWRRCWRLLRNTMEVKRRSSC
jgi:hypothetical protein